MRTNIRKRLRTHFAVMRKRGWTVPGPQELGKNVGKFLSFFNQKENLNKELHCTWVKIDFRSDVPK